MIFRIRKESIYEFLLLFFVFTLCFISFSWLPFASTIKYVLILLLAVLIFFRLSDFIRAVLELNHLLILYIVLILISGIINRNAHIYTHTVLNSAAYALTVIELVFVTGYAASERGTAFLTRVLTGTVIFYLIINDLLLLIVPNVFPSEGESLFFVGNKFSVSFLHIVAFYLVLAECRNRKIGIIERLIICSFLLLLLLLVSIKVNCMTGVVAVLFILILGILPSGFFESPVSAIAIAVLAVLFPLISSAILSIPIVNYFVVDILNRSISLTGRTDVFLKIPVILKGHLLFGYGYGTAYETWTSYIFFMPNAQNGLLNNIVEVGLIATAVFTAYVVYGISKVRKLERESRMRLLPFLKVLFLFLILSSIEISTDLGYCFIAVLINEAVKAEKSASRLSEDSSSYLS